MNTSLESLFELQSKNRWKIARTPAKVRIEKLQRLKKTILESEQELIDALAADFSKPVAEVHLTEIFPVIGEINFMSAHLKKWMKPRKVPTPVSLWGSRTEIRSEPRGLCLILAPWNYPFQLLLSPLVAAVAAGNCVIAKPSEKTPATSKYLARLIRQVFPEDEVALVEGDASVAEALLELPFDHIFFTGSTAIGKKVMAAAAKHLSSLTLELGGKSPVVITEDADLKSAAERIVWAKLINAGQTCVAPDYVLVPESRADEFATLIKARIEEVFGSTWEEQKKAPHLARIVDTKAWSRLKGLLDETLKEGARLLTGGHIDANERFFSPTVFDFVSADSVLMKEEIFGPLLPVLRYQRLEQAIASIQKQEKPLALYIFGRETRDIENLLASTTAGGTVVNHLLVQFANSHAPFGGVGASGQGSYHGYHGFQTFSHQRTVVHQSHGGLTSWVFPPYRGRRLKLALWFMRKIS